MMPQGLQPPFLCYDGCRFRFMSECQRPWHRYVCMSLPEAVIISLSCRLVITPNSPQLNPIVTVSARYNINLWAAGPQAPVSVVILIYTHHDLSKFVSFKTNRLSSVSAECLDWIWFEDCFPFLSLLLYKCNTDNNNLIIIPQYTLTVFHRTVDGAVWHILPTLCRLEQHPASTHQHILFMPCMKSPVVILPHVIKRSVKHLGARFSRCCWLELDVQSRFLAFPLQVHTCIGSQMSKHLEQFAHHQEL